MVPLASPKRTLRQPLLGAATAGTLLCCTLALSPATVLANPVHTHTPSTSKGYSTPAPPPPVGAPAAEAPAPAPVDAQTPPAQPAQPRQHRPQPAHRRTQHPTGVGSGRAGATSHSASTPEQAAGQQTSTQGDSTGSASQPKVRHDRVRESTRHTPALPSTSASIGMSQPAAAPAATTAAAAAVATVASAPAVQTSTTPSPPKSASRPSKPAGSRPRRAAARRGGTAGRAATTATAAAATLAPGEIAASASRTAVPARAQRAAHPAARKTSGESPLVKTVTKIINVVPSFVGVLIGALIAIALALAASSRLAAARARRFSRQRLELLDDVGLLQAALLPPLPGRIGPVGTSAAYRPASGPGAGGDFYDIFALGDGQVAVIVGDVSGHGREALPHTTLVRYTLRAYLEAGLSPRAALQTAAPVLERQLGESFATVVLATYNPRERVLRYSCAGHPPPLVIGSESIVPITACSAPPIGVGRATGLRQTAVSIPGAALVCFYTDGVIEARVAGELYGSERLERALAELGADASASTVLERVAETSDRHPDDMAACVLRVEGEPAAPSVEVEELELDSRAATGDRAERFLLAGGVHPAQAGEIVAAVRGELARHGRLVLEMRLGEHEPEITLRPQNVAILQTPPLLQAASARGGSA
jgi:serine phosphatase RsbU (regulator of sigma subunit)